MANKTPQHANDGLKARAHRDYLARLAREREVEVAQRRIEARAASEALTVQTRGEVSELALQSQVVATVRPGLGKSLLKSMLEYFPQAPVAAVGSYQTTIVVRDGESGWSGRVSVELPESKPVDPRKWAIDAAMAQFSGARGLTPATVKFAEGRFRRALDAGLVAYAEGKRS